MDTPGFFDFFVDVQSALRVADSAVVVVCGVSGVEVGTEKVWKCADEYQLPRLVFINKLNRENANFEAALEQLRSHFGVKVFPLQFPIGKEDSFRGVVDLVKMKALLYEDEAGLKIREDEIPADLLEKAEELREKVVEAAAEADDNLMEKYLEEESLEEGEVLSALRIGTLEGKIIPVLCGSATKNLGMQPLLDLIAGALPSPADRPAVFGKIPGKDEEVTRQASPDELCLPLFLKPWQTLRGRVNYVRVYSAR